MGKILSKSTRRAKQTRGDARLQDDDGLTVTSMDIYDQNVVKRLQKQLTDDLDTFLVNHLLMGWMFCRNFESEVQEASETKNSLNVKLEKFQHSCIRPDVVAEIVNSHLKYRPKHGEKKECFESLLDHRLLIVHDDIEIGTGEDAHYSGIDVEKQCYAAKLEPSERIGYAKLRYLLDGKSKLSISSGSSVESRLADSGSEQGDYGMINEARTPKPLHMRESNSLKYPPNFVQVIKTKNLEIDKRENLKSEDFYKLDYYLNSSELMRHFIKDGFSMAIAKVLGFEESDLENANSTSTAIYCRSGRGLDAQQWEIVPAITIAWPKQLNEWFERSDRNIITDRTGKTFQWPSERMVKEVRTMNCVVYPRGYMPKRGKNKERHLEWEVGFPQAERYLESKMVKVHVKAFVFLVALHKTFVEPVTEKKGLTIAHIRTVILWEIEENAIRWPEDRLGTKVLAIVKKLYDAMAKHTLPDYFIRQKNLFENVPGVELRKNMDALHLIREAPVMHFILALRNVHTVSADFYPTLEIDEIRKTLTEDIMKQTNPAIFAIKVVRGPSIKAKKINTEDDWKRERREAKKREREKKLKEQREKEDTNLKQMAESADSINLSWTSGKDFARGPLYEKPILLFFLKHFMKIVESSAKYNDRIQALFYLKHCSYLAKILQSFPACEEEGLAYATEIRKVTADVQTSDQYKSRPPVTPLRNSMYLPSNMLLKDNIVDRTRLQEQHRSGYVSQTRQRLKSQDGGGASPGPSRVAFSTDEIAASDVQLRQKGANPSPTSKVSFNMDDIADIEI